METVVIKTNLELSEKQQTDRMEQIARLPCYKGKDVHFVFKKGNEKPYKQQKVKLH